jgi:hypothetical protein
MYPACCGPAWQGDRWIGAISAVKARAPVLGGNVSPAASCDLDKTHCERSR